MFASACRLPEPLRWRAAVSRSPAPASAALLARKDLSLDTAVRFETTARRTCKGQGFGLSPVVAARRGAGCAERRRCLAPATPWRIDAKAIVAHIPDAVRRVRHQRQGRAHAWASASPHIVASQGALPIKVGEGQSSARFGV